ncbi:MAG: hypothetical protein H7222_05220 [Methylotenera sp.]|nr:hypothetical protein [Oligoflexia bacterium]
MKKWFSPARSFSLILFSSCASLCLTATLSLAAPAQVVILRHGEKPDVGNDLSPQGYARAKGLVAFFQTSPLITKFGTPVALYAASPVHDDGSVRSIETLTPTSQALKLPLHTQFNKHQIPEMVREILGTSAYDNKTVIICLPHASIPETAHQFGAVHAPADWTQGAYDRVWILGFAHGQVTSFQDRPEHVLPGDSAQLRAHHN